MGVYKISVRGLISKGYIYLMKLLGQFTKFCGQYPATGYSAAVFLTIIPQKPAVIFALFFIEAKYKRLRKRVSNIFQI
jgi:hypothetical protein